MHKTVNILTLVFSRIAYLGPSKKSCVKLAYAYETLGQFDKAMACLAPLEPEKLKNHTLGGLAITCNQKMRLLLLQENTEEAAECLKSLRTIADTATERAPALGHNTENVSGCMKTGCPC